MAIFVSFFRFVFWQQESRQKKFALIMNEKISRGLQLIEKGMKIVEQGRKLIEEVKLASADPIPGSSRYAAQVTRKQNEIGQEVNQRPILTAKVSKKAKFLPILQSLGASQLQARNTLHTSTPLFKSTLPTASKKRKGDDDLLITRPKASLHLSLLQQIIQNLAVLKCIVKVFSDEEKQPSAITGKTIIFNSFQSAARNEATDFNQSFLSFTMSNRKNTLWNRRPSRSKILVS